MKHCVLSFNWKFPQKAMGPKSAARPDRQGRRENMHTSAPVVGQKTASSCVSKLRLRILYVFTTDFKKRLRRRKRRVFSFFRSVMPMNPEPERVIEAHRDQGSVQFVHSESGNDSIYDSGPIRIVLAEDGERDRAVLLLTRHFIESINTAIRAQHDLADTIFMTQTPEVATRESQCKLEERLEQYHHSYEAQRVMNHFLETALNDAELLSPRSLPDQRERVEQEHCEPNHLVKDTGRRSNSPVQQIESGVSEPVRHTEAVNILPPKTVSRPADPVNRATGQLHGPHFQSPVAPIVRKPVRGATRPSRTQSSEVSPKNAARNVQPDDGELSAVDHVSCSKSYAKSSHTVDDKALEGIIPNHQDGCLALSDEELAANAVSTTKTTSHLSPKEEISRIVSRRSWKSREVTHVSARPPKNTAFLILRTDTSDQESHDLVSRDSPQSDRRAPGVPTRQGGEAFVKSNKATIHDSGWARNSDKPRTGPDSEHVAKPRVSDIEAMSTGVLARSYYPAKRRLVRAQLKFDIREEERYLSYQLYKQASKDAGREINQELFDLGWVDNISKRRRDLINAEKAFDEARTAAIQARYVLHDDDMSSGFARQSGQGQSSESEGRIGPLVTARIEGWLERIPATFAAESSEEQQPPSIHQDPWHAEEIDLWESVSTVAEGRRRQRILRYQQKCDSDGKRAV